MKSKKDSQIAEEWARKGEKAGRILHFFFKTHGLKIIIISVSIVLGIIGFVLYLGKYSIFGKKR